MPFRAQFFDVNSGRLLDKIDLTTPRTEPEAKEMARGICLDGQRSEVEWVGPGKPADPPKVPVAAPTTSMFQPRARTVSIDRASDLLQVSRRTVYNWIRDGRLQSVRTPGGSQRIIVESMPNRAA